MREKLAFLMKSEQLTMTKLAELLGIQPSGISHILNGRNNPSLDMVQKILRRFPQVNPDWLLLDKGEMYRASQQSQQLSLSSDEQQPASSDINSTVASTTSQGDTSAMPASIGVTAQTTANSTEQNSIVSLAANPSRVKRVILLMDDHTFESYEMKR